MNRRHITAVLAGGVLMLWAIFGSGVSCAGAAETKVTPPAPPATAAKATAVTAAPAAPATGPATAAKTTPAAPSAAPAAKATAATATPAAPATQTAAPATAPGAPATAAVAETKEAPPAYSYNPSGKSDPFKPFMETEPLPPKKQEPAVKQNVAVKGKGISAMPISPLQQREIEQFRLIGIAGDDTKRNALVEDRVSKKYYPLAVGTYIGTNTGRVVSILPDRVIVEERIGTEAKKAQIRRMTLMLHTEDEVKK